MIYLVRSIKNSCNSIASKQTNKQTNHDVKRTWIDTLPEKTCRWPTIQEKVLNTTNYQGNAMKITVMYHLTAVRMKLKMKVAQSCPTLCDPIAYTVHGILQARILEWVAVPFSRGSSQPRDWTQVSHIVGGFFTSWATREAQISVRMAIFKKTRDNKCWQGCEEKATLVHYW